MQIRLRGSTVWVVAVEVDLGFLDQNGGASAAPHQDQVLVKHGEKGLFQRRTAVCGEVKRVHERCNFVLEY